MMSPEQFSKVFEDTGKNMEKLSIQTGFAEKGLYGVGQQSYRLQSIFRELQASITGLKEATEENSRVLVSSGGTSAEAGEKKEKLKSPKEIVDDLLSSLGKGAKGAASDPLGTASSAGKALGDFAKEAEKASKATAEGIGGLTGGAKVAGIPIVALGKAASAAATGINVITTGLVLWDALQKSVMTDQKDMGRKLAASGEAYNQSFIDGATIQMKGISRMGISTEEFSKTISLSSAKNRDFITAMEKNPGKLVEDVAKIWMSTGLSSSAVLSQVMDNMKRFGMGVGENQSAFRLMKAITDETGTSMEVMLTAVNTVTKSHRIHVKSQEDVIKTTMPFIKSLEEGKLGMETFTKVLYGSQEQSKENILTQVSVLQRMPEAIAGLDKKMGEGVTKLVNETMAKVEMGDAAAGVAHFREVMAKTPETAVGVLEAFSRVAAVSMGAKNLGTSLEQAERLSWTFGESLGLSRREMLEMLEASKLSKKEHINLEEALKRTSNKAQDFTKALMVDTTLNNVKSIIAQSITVMGINMGAGISKAGGGAVKAVGAVTGLNEIDAMAEEMSGGEGIYTERAEAARAAGKRMAEVVLESENASQNAQVKAIVDAFVMEHQKRKQPFSAAELHKVIEKALDDQAKAR